jgi:hypothetical protein
VSGFSADWLGLREPIDQRSRNPDILAAIERYFSTRESVTAIDLASGRGSIVRALSPRLPPLQDWHLIDDEPALLRDATRAGTGTIHTHSRLANLAEAIEDVLAIDADLVVSSAFIDLVSDAWLDRLVRSAVARRLPVYLAMSYDGEVACDPRHPLDDPVFAAFGRHQQRDKGFGPALGPMAGTAAARKFAAAGYEVTRGRADWRLARTERDVQRMMVEGWFAAVSELEMLDRPAVTHWRDQRLAWVAEGRTTMTVGHLDIWAVPR